MLKGWRLITLVTWSGKWGFDAGGRKFAEETLAPGNIHNKVNNHFLRRVHLEGGILFL